LAVVAPEQLTQQPRKAQILFLVVLPQLVEGLVLL
jgi:hypothetical protein